MFRLIKQPCVNYVPTLLAELEKHCHNHGEDGRLWVYLSSQGVVIKNTTADRSCLIQVWGAVSVKCEYVVSGQPRGQYATTINEDVAHIVKDIITFFERGNES